MKPKITTVLLLLVILSAADVCAQIVWEKFSGNPIVPAGTYDGNDPNALTYALEPSVLYDSADNLYRMWFISRVNYQLSVSTALSRDGTTWYLYLRNPVLRPGTVGSFDSQSIYSCEVIREGSQYVMYYSGGNGSVIQIGMATSPDGFAWQKYSGNPILTVGPSGFWDSKAIAYPHVLRDATTYLLWYNGWDFSDLSATGLATSTDGVYWTKHPSNPVLNYGPPGSWEGNVAAVADVAKKDSVFYMLYRGLNLPALRTCIGLATSPNGVDWTKFGGNPVLQPGPPGQWDDLQLGTGELQYSQNEFRLWYGGSPTSGNVWQIGYATSEFAPFGTPNISVSADTLNFGRVYLGYSDTLSIDIRNTGFDTLEVTSLLTTDTGFTVLDSSSFELLSGQSRSIRVTFSPVATGNFQGSLSIASNDPGEPTLQVALRGTAVLAPSIAFRPDTLAFALAQGDSASATLALLNAGGSYLDYRIATEGGGQEIIGSMQHSFQGNSRSRGNIFYCETPTALREMLFYMNIASSTELRYLVYEGNSSVGPFELIFQRVIGNSGTGSGFYSSGRVAVMLQGGKYYYVATAFQGYVSYYLQDTVLPRQISFGLLVAGAGDGTYPPPSVVSPFTNPGGVYYQSILSGDLFVSSVSPDTGSINPLDSALVEVDVIADLPLGNYETNLRILSNDPVRPVLNVPTRLDVITAVENPDATIPKEYRLYQSFPNPFNPSTIINYDIPKSSSVTITIYNLLGQEVAKLVNEERAPGRYSVSWNAQGVSSGAYWYRMTADSFVEVRRMIFVK